MPIRHLNASNLWRVTGLKLQN
uniref:Uncharacterized protein n=1 Tax=Rhizophora mucronata TaxID=61149 RepID=A0A2P2J0T1_RHIMU